MARQKKKRQCGTGSIIREKLGLAIRWPEYILREDGTKKRKMRYEFLGEVTSREANDKLIERVAQARREGPKAATQAPLTFNAHVDRWQRDILDSAGDGAADLYKFSVRDTRSIIIRARLKPRFGDFPLTEFSAEGIQEWIRELREEGLAPSTIHTYHKALDVVLRAAVTWKHLAVNPADGVELPRLKGREKRKKWALTAKEAGELLSRIVALRPRAMVALAITTGLRRGELIAARWKHLDAGASEIAVVEASYRGHIDTPKTDAGIRQVPLDQWTLGLLEQWRRRSKHQRPDDFIFATRTGKQENPQNIIRRYVFPACEALKLRRATFTTFRRTYSSLLHKESIPLKTIAELMGHADERTPFIYIQGDDSMKRVASDKVGDEVSRNAVQIDQMSLPWVN